MESKFDNKMWHKMEKDSFKDDITVLKNRIKGISFIEDKIVADLYRAFSTSRYNESWKVLTKEIELEFEQWVIEDSGT